MATTPVWIRTDNNKSPQPSHDEAKLLINWKFALKNSILDPLKPGICYIMYSTRWYVWEGRKSWASLCRKKVHSSAPAPTQKGINKVKLFLGALFFNFVKLEAHTRWYIIPVIIDSIFCSVNNLLLFKRQTYSYAVHRGSSCNVKMKLRKLEKKMWKVFTCRLDPERLLASYSRFFGLIIHNKKSFFAHTTIHNAPTRTMVGLWGIHLWWLIIFNFSPPQPPCHTRTHFTWRLWLEPHSLNFWSTYTHSVFLAYNLSQRSRHRRGKKTFCWSLFFCTLVSLQDLWDGRRERAKWRKKIGWEVRNLT